MGSGKGSETGLYHAVTRIESEGVSEEINLLCLSDPLTCLFPLPICKME